jgi:shikimate kinase
MVKNSIALIGFMATGKTVIGKALVAYLGEDYKFIEMDQIIIQHIHKSIPKIFAEEGEEKFREYETNACKKISRLNKVVISCGGGVVLNENNMKLLKKKCHIILLKTNPEEIYKRIMKNGKKKRPVIDKENPKVEIMKIYNFRKPFYEKFAEISIDTTGKTIDDIVQEIITKTFRKT